MLSASTHPLVDIGPGRYLRSHREPSCDIRTPPGRRSRPPTWPLRPHQAHHRTGGLTMSPDDLMHEKTWHGQVYSDGWTTAHGGDAAVREPATGNEIGRVGRADADDVARAGEHAARARRDWAATSFEERAAVLRRAGALFERCAPASGRCLVREAGSIPPKAVVETYTAAQEWYQAAALASRPLGEILATA